MKRLVFLTVFLLSVSLVFARDGHFIYLRIDNSMEAGLVKRQIERFAPIFRQGDFVLYYSNAKRVMDAQTYDEQELFGLVSEQMSSYDITLYQELDMISVLLEKYFELELDGNHQVYSRQYNRLVFDFIVGKDFLDKDYPNDILARGILINSLDEIDMQFNFYPCGSDYQKVELNPLYQIKHQINIANL